MNCPYCDSLVREVPDNRCCPNCGGPLGACVPNEVPEERVLPEPPLGVYRQAFSLLEIHENGMRFYKKFVWIETDQFVPYEEVDRVKFVPGGKDLGFLCVRSKKEKDRPMIATAKEAPNDPTTISFTDYYNDRYVEIYRFLQKVCQMNN